MLESDLSCVVCFLIQDKPIVLFFVTKRYALSVMFIVNGIHHIPQAFYSGLFYNILYFCLLCISLSPSECLLLCLLLYLYTPAFDRRFVSYLNSIPVT